MYRCLVLLLAFVATTNGRVVPTSPNIPYQVSVQLFNSTIMKWEHNCGGSILNSRVVITAAHCVGGWASNFLIEYGSAKMNNGKTVKFARIDKHEGFNSNLDNDVAIIHLAEDIVFGPNVQPIALASKSPDPDKNAVASSWGRPSMGSPNFSDILQAVNVEIVDHSVCRKQYAKEKKKHAYLHDVTDSMLCAGVYGSKKNICRGDSGGPLVVNNELVGIASWGNLYKKTRLVTGFPGVYADVAYLRKWIDKKMKKD